MKYIYSAIAFFLISTVIHAQTAYYDALELAKLAKNEKTEPNIPRTERAFQILDHYLPEVKTPRSFNDIEIAYDAPTPDKPDPNPFIQIGGTFHGLTNFIPQAKNLIQNVGGLDVTNFADGLSKFLVERAKEEVNVAFFQRLKRYFKYEAPEMKILFPNTVVLLDNFEAWDYANVLITLREAFDQDLRNLMLSITKLNLTSAEANAKPRVKHRVDSIKKFFDCKAGHLLSASLFLSDALVNNKKFPDALNQTCSEHLYKAFPQDTGAVELLNILSLSIRHSDINKNYISMKELNSLFNDTNARTIFIGLIYEQIKTKDIRLGGQPIAKTIEDAFANYNTIKDYLVNLIKNADRLNKAYASLTETRSKSETDLSKQISATLYSASQLIQSIYNVETIHSSLHIPDNIRQILEYCNSGIGIASEISIKNYNAAIIKTLKLISDVANANSVTLPAEFMKDLVKYGSFAANIVNAKSSDEVKKAIDAVALPVGSYSIKRNNAFNIAVNGYLGVGYDSGNPGSASKETVDARQKYNIDFSLFAPVGISFNFALRTKDHSLGSISIFGSVLDIGSLAHFRLLSDTTKLDRKILLKDILSPGVSLIYGIPRCPVSLSFGVFHKPGMAFDGGQNKIVTVPGMTRFTAGILIDIPVVNIFSKQKLCKKW